MPRLIAIFITHTHDRIARSVMSMAAQTSTPDHIVVSCDGDSERIRVEIQRAAQRLGRSVLLVTRPHTGQARPAQTRNNAVRAVRDRYGLDDSDRLVFLDGDCLAMPPVLGVHEAALRRRDLCLGWRVELSDSQSAALTDEQVMAGDFAGIVSPFQLAEVARAARVYARRDIQRRFGLAKPHKPQVLGANFGIGAGAYRAVNGLDESFTGWGMEDDDLGRRVYALGGKPALRLRDCLVLHQFHPSRSRGAWRENEHAHRIAKPFETACKHGLENPLPQPEPCVDQIRPGPALPDAILEARPCHEQSTSLTGP